MYRRRRFDDNDCCCCFRNRDIDQLCLLVIGCGAALVGISSLVPRWRYDPNGLQNWAKVVPGASIVASNFYSRGVGLVFVMGSSTTTWNSQAASVCTQRDVSAVGNVLGTLSKMLTTWDASYCAGVGKCDFTPTIALNIRCEEYKNLDVYGILTLTFTLIGMSISASSMLVGCQCSKAKAGGCIFGMNLLSSFAILIFNLVWAFASDRAFKRIMFTAWYPYPVLGVAWYLHLFGSIIMLIGTIFYGISVMPDFAIYDPMEGVTQRREQLQMNRNINNQPGPLVGPPMMAPPMMASPMVASPMMGRSVMMQPRLQPQPMLMMGRSSAPAAIAMGNPGTDFGVNAVVAIGGPPLRPNFT